MGFAVIIAAGGSGRRLGADCPKAFVLLQGKPLIQWSIPTFQGISGYGGVVAAVPADMRSQAEEYLAPYDARVVTGGRLRQDSVMAALQAVPADIEWVAVHDAARPVVAAADIRKTLAAAAECDGAVLSRPVTDTLKQVAEGRIVGTADRSCLWRAETPQIFRREVLIESCRRWDGGAATDDAQIVCAAGFDVRVVQADHTNPKVTFPEDLRLLERHFKGSQK